jgi:hypothetical protein
VSDQSGIRRNLVGFDRQVELPEKAKPQVEYLIRERAFELPFLKAWLNSSDRQCLQTGDELLGKRNPNDWRIRLREARKQYDETNNTAAIGLLCGIIAKQLNFAAALASLGRCLIADGHFDPLAPSLSHRPDSAASLES